MKLLHASIAALAAAALFKPEAEAGSGTATSIALSILDVEGFTVGQPYSEGHTCSAAEAKVLNQTRKENLGNNFRPKIKAYKDALEAGQDPEVSLDQLIADFAKADSEYVFTIANVGATVKRTPEEREARALAKEYVKSALEADGLKVNVAPEGYTDESWKDALEAEYERIAGTDEIKKIAAETIKKRAAVGKLQLGNLSLGGQASEATPA